MKIRQTSRRPCARAQGPPVQGQTAAAERRREEARRPGIQDRRAIRRSNRTAQLNLKVAPEFKRVVFAGADQEGVLLVEHVEGPSCTTKSTG